MAKKGQKMAVFLPWRVEFRPFFHNFLQITSKYAQKHHIKKSEKSAGIRGRLAKRGIET